MGRPTKLTKELQEKICAHLREGLFRKHAAGRERIDEDSLSRWYHRGATEDRGIYREFFLAVNEAESEFAKTGTDTLKAAAAANPNHVKWLLSRRFPELYGRRDNVETVNPEDKAADQAALRELLMDRLSKFLPEEQSPIEPEKASEPVILTPEKAPDQASEGLAEPPKAPSEAVSDAVA